MKRKKNIPVVIKQLNVGPSCRKYQIENFQDNFYCIYIFSFTLLEAMTVHPPLTPPLRVSLLIPTNTCLGLKLLQCNRTISFLCFLSILKKEFFNFQQKNLNQQVLTCSVYFTTDIFNIISLFVHCFRNRKKGG